MNSLTNIAAVGDYASDHATDIHSSDKATLDRSDNYWLTLVEKKIETNVEHFF